MVGLIAQHQFSAALRHRIFRIPEELNGDIAGFGLQEYARGRVPQFPQRIVGFEDRRDIGE